MASTLAVSLFGLSRYWGLRRKRLLPRLYCLFTSQQVPLLLIFLSRQTQWIPLSSRVGEREGYEGTLPVPSLTNFPHIFCLSVVSLSLTTSGASNPVNIPFTVASIHWNRFQTHNQLAFSVLVN